MLSLNTENVVLKTLFAVYRLVLHVSPMNRQQFLRRSALPSLPATFPRIGSAAQNGPRSEETFYKSAPIRRADNSYLQYSTHCNFDDLAAKDPTAEVQIIITVSDFPTATETNGPTGLYTLERIGGPRRKETSQS